VGGPTQRRPGDDPSVGPGWADLAALSLTFFALGVTVNVLVLDRVGSASLTVVAAVAINAATTELAYLAVRDAGGTQLAAVIAGWVVASRFGLLAVSLGARLRVGRWHRAAAALQSFDPNVTLAIQQTTPGAVVRVFWRVTAAMHLGWLAGVAVGVFLGNIIGEAQRFGLDAVFPAALLAIIGNLLRQRSSSFAAAAGGGLCLLLIPVAPAGIPIIASLSGAVAALLIREDSATVVDEQGGATT
jgi:predicted branched-subunit amino acid permease